MVRLKLLIDNKGQRVMFAEAGKDFVDFIFSLLELPIGPVIKLLNCNKNSFGNFYQSISDFRNHHFQYDQEVGSKRKHPHFISSSLVGDDWWSPSPSPTIAKFYYTCGRGALCTAPMLSPVADSVCNKCRFVMDKIVTHYVISTTSTEASVNAPRRFMITDDLVVTPVSSISCISLLSKFNIKDVCGLEERDVQIGMDEGAKLLKHALGSKTVLTNLFLATKGKDENLKADV